jgi:DNA-binding CsgD family transcriptional regulator
VARLTHADLDAALGFVREGHAETGPDPFPTYLIELLRALIGSEWAAYCELDRPRRRTRARTSSPDTDDEASEEAFWRLLDQHPLCRAQAAGRFEALKLSDFMSRRELRRLELYSDFLRPAGVEFELEVAIPSPLENTKTFLFDHSRRDFGERERTLLNIIQPHLAQLYRAADVRRLAALALVCVEGEREPAAGGVLLVAPGDRIELASERARRLLATYFADASEGRLPDRLAAWITRARSAADAELGRRFGPLAVTRPFGTLIVDRVRLEGANVLILSELAAGQRQPPVLTRREREVLELVAEGKQNAEIAQVLWVAPSTVRKHLENIYGKLGVGTRTAAVARMRGSPAHDV